MLRSLPRAPNRINSHHPLVNKSAARGVWIDAQRAQPL